MRPDRPETGWRLGVEFAGVSGPVVRGTEALWHGREDLLQTTQTRRLAVPSPLLTKRGNANYVLGALTLCYVLNTMDRSQILAASLQAIKSEFGASDFQMGMLSGIPFALFYTLIGHPDRGLGGPVQPPQRPRGGGCDVERMTARVRHGGGELRHPLRGARRHRLGEGEAAWPSHSLISDYFSQSRAGAPRSRPYALGVPIGTIARRRARGWGTRTRLANRRSSSRACPACSLRYSYGLRSRSLRADYPRRRVAVSERTPVPPMLEVLRTLWQRRSFRHLTLAAALPFGGLVRERRL